jgi:hypothetical protein
VSYLVFVHELITQIAVAYYDQDWGTRWRKGRLLRKQLLAAFGVYGSLAVLLWWSLG